MKFTEKLFGTHSERELKRIYPIVDKIEALRPTMQALTDEELRAKTKEYKDRYNGGESLDSILPEAFATVREAAKRSLGMEHHRVQLIGGIILHQGRIAEMKTGEGKTLVSTLPAYLNALTGRGVHIVTVNDYLANRDAEWMGKVHRFLGLTVGVVLNDMKNDERRQQYACDITYITNNELGFDYLRDNMVIYKEQLVQRELAYCIIDEGRLRPDRRGKNTSDYFRTEQQIHQAVRDRRYSGTPDAARRGKRRDDQDDRDHGRGDRGDRRLHRQREGQIRYPDR